MRDELQGLCGIVRRRTGLSHEDLHGCTTDNSSGRADPLRNAAADRVTRKRPKTRAVRALAVGLLATSTGCGPRLRLPPLLSPPPGSLAPEDAGATLARQLAPVLYLHPDESFPLVRVVAVLHPTRPIIAYHLLWQDDVHLAWAPFTRPSDQEIVWVGYDSTGAPVDVWTYWHKRVLHVPWPKRQVLIDVQWGKHGSMPRATRLGDLPPDRSLEGYYLLSWAGLLDLWLGRLSRPGPMCFCGSYARYATFTKPLGLSGRLDVITRAEDPNAVLEAVFGKVYSRKGPWP